MKTFNQYLTEYESKEVPGRQVSDKELIKILGKGKTKSLLNNPFFREYSSYERAYKYGVTKVGFQWVEVYFYFSSIHKKPDGKIRPEIMVRFEFSYSGWSIINAHKHMRAKEPDEMEQRHGPSAGWRYVTSWKDIKE